jgi:hypothetical protein
MSSATVPGVRRARSSSATFEVAELSVREQLECALALLADGGPTETSVRIVERVRLEAYAIAGFRLVGPVYAGDLPGALAALRDRALWLAEQLERRAA